MENKSISLATALMILTKTITNTEEDKIRAIAQNWINCFSQYDKETVIIYQKPEDENRLWFMFEEQKDSILSQLESHEATNPAVDVDTTPEFEKISENIEEAATVIAETITQAPFPTPTIEEATQPEKQIAIIPAPQTVIKTISPRQHEDTLAESSQPFPQFFSAPKKTASAFNESLCMALESAFKTLNSRSNEQFETIIAKLADIETDFKQELIDIESRMNTKLQTILNICCISANNTEAMTGMFSKQTVISKHTPDFTV